MEVTITWLRVRKRVGWMAWHSSQTFLSDFTICIALILKDLVIVSTVVPGYALQRQGEIKTVLQGPFAHWSLNAASSLNHSSTTYHRHTNTIVSPALYPPTLKILLQTSWLPPLLPPPSLPLLLLTPANPWKWIWRPYPSNF